MKWLVFLSCILSLFSCSSNVSAMEKSPAQVLQWLKRGNVQFQRNPKYAKQRKALVNGQSPPVVILSCSDSRVTPTIVYSKFQLGQIFNEAVAGNVAGNAVVDSMNFALLHLSPPPTVFVIQGHTECSAVKSALDALIENGGRISVDEGVTNAIIVPIQIAIKSEGVNIYAKDALYQSVLANVRYQTKQVIKKSLDIRNAVKNENLLLIGAVYHIETGKVKTILKINSHNVDLIF